MSITKEIKFTRAHLEYLERMFPEKTDLRTVEELFTQQGKRSVIAFIRDKVIANERRVSYTELSSKSS